MADSAIFKYANDITMNRSAASARSVTTGGYARTHRLGPSLLSINAKLPLLSEEQFLEVENELLSIEDGIKFLEVNPSSNNGNNIINTKSIPLKSGETEIKVMRTTYSSLRELVLTNLQPNTEKIFKVGDYVQFYNSSKVYQISKPLGFTGAYFNSSNAGTVRVRLSSPLVSNIGVSTNNTSYGRTVEYYFVNGYGDFETVEYDWTAGSGTDSYGRIDFVDTNGNPYLYADGTAAVCYLYTGEYRVYEISGHITNGIAGNAMGAFEDYKEEQNNKLGQILDSSTYSGSTDGTLILNFNTPGIRAVLTTPTKPGQSLTNENVTNLSVSPYQDGSLTIMNTNNTIAKDVDGNDLVINIPKKYKTAQEIYNYLRNDIFGSNSTHPLRTSNVWDYIQSGSFQEYYNETKTDLVGSFIIRWGAEYDGCILSYVPTGTIATNYNNYELMNDTVATKITDGITIENSQHTYTAGEYLQPAWVFYGTSYTKKILSVSVVGTTTTINFDPTFSSGTSGWYSGTASNNTFMRHQNDSLSTSTGFIKEMETSSDATFYTSSYPVKMGNDINIKLMLTKKPAVTIVPKNEEENLYVYDQFEFTEVL